MEHGLIKFILRGTQIGLLVITTGLIGHVIAANKHGAGNATALINFSMFTLVVAWLVALYGIAARAFHNLEKPVVLLGLDGFTALLTMITSIALAGKLGVPNCGSLDPKSHPSDYIVWGSSNDGRRCRELQAGDVFFFFLFFSFVATTLFSFMDRKRGGYGGSIAGSSKPSMSQFRGGV